MSSVATPEEYKDPTNFLSALEQIALSANTGSTTRKVLRGIVQTVAKLSPWDLCWAGILDLKADRITMQFDSGFGGMQDPRLLRRPLSGSPSMVALELERPLVIPDVTLDTKFPLLREDGARRGFRSTIIIPLVLEEDRGALWLCAPEPREISSRDLAFATIVGSLTRVALSNVQYQSRQRVSIEKEKVHVAELSRLNEFSHKQNDELRRLADVHDRLLKSVLKNQGLTDLAQTISEILGAGILLIDRFSNKLASIRIDDAVEASILAGLSDATWDGSFHMSGIKAVPVGISGLPTITCAIVSNNETLGWICVPILPETDPVDTTVVEQSCLLIALELLKERIHLDAEMRLKNDFVQALLSTDSTTSSRLLQRATVIGLDFNKQNRILRIRFTGSVDIRGSTLMPLAAHIAQYIQRTHKGSFAVPIGDRDMIIAVPWPNAKEPIGALTSDIRTAVQRASKVLPSGDDAVIQVSIGIGSAGSGVDHLRQSQMDATKALEVIDALRTPDIDMTLEAAGSYSLLTELSGLRTDTFVQRYLTQLEGYDRTKNSDLVSTLEAYFDESGSAQRTADRLNIHITTLKYRLRRIEEIAQVSLADPESRLCLELAMRIKRLERASDHS